MMINEELQSPTYTPENLIDGVISFLKLRNDAQLSRALKVGPPVISKIRKRTYGVTPSMLIKMHDVTGISIDELRKMGGITNTVGIPTKESENA